MAVFSGLAGDVTYDSTEELNVRSWTVTETAQVATGAHSTSAGWTDAAAGNKAWSGSFDFYQDATTIQPIRAGGAAAIDMSDGDANSYTGNVVVSEVSYTNDIEGAELCGGTVSFVGNGALTIS